MSRWILRWRDVAASYTEEELELVRTLIARAERHVDEPGAAHQAAQEWDVLHLLKTELDATIVEPVTTPGCMAPIKCAVHGCIGVCATREVPASYPAASDGELFFPVESVEELEAGRLRRDP